MTLTGEIVTKTVLSGDIGRVTPAPAPPAPTRGDHYITDKNYTAVRTAVITKEVDQ